MILDTWNTTDGCGSWKVVGGTSLAVALVASIFAVTGNGQVSPKYAYDHPENFHDVLQGDNGCPDGSVICTARKGYDGPTGFGSPNASLMAAKSVQAHR